MNELDEFELLSRKKITAKLSGTGNAVLICIVLIAALVSLGEITLTLSGVVNVSLMVIVLYVIASVVYRNSYVDRFERAKGEEQYLKVKAEFDKACKDIYDKDLLVKLPGMCLEYAQDDLKNARTSLLLDACIPYELYEREYLGKTVEQLTAMELPPETVKCIVSANKVKAMRLTATTLLSTGEDENLVEKMLRKVGVRRSIGIESKTRQQIDFTSNMLSRALTTLLAGAVGVNVVLDDFSIRTIALWAMKMLPIAIAAISGGNSGARNVYDTLIPLLERKTKIINIIISRSEHISMPKNPPCEKA